MEVYVDDMLTKSTIAEKHTEDLKETFDVLRKYQMKLNPSKCVFGVPSGRFLGFQVHQRGIEVNPEKIKALEGMASPKALKDVQRLTGCLASLNQFIAKSTDKCAPFFKAIKKGKGLEWSTECEEAFQKLKEYLGRAPIETKYTTKITLCAGGPALVDQRRTIAQANFGLSVGRQALPPAPVQRRHTGRSALVAGAGPHQRTTSGAPLGNLRRGDKFGVDPTGGRNTKASVLHKQSIVSGRNQVLAGRKNSASSDHIGQEIEAIFSSAYNRGIYRLPTKTHSSKAGGVGKADQMGSGAQRIRYQIHTKSGHQRAGDGSSNTHGSGAGIVITTPEGDTVECAMRFDFKATNNQAEYEALLAGLRVCIALGADELEVYSDSQVVVNQVLDEYQAREEHMIAYLDIAKRLLKKFKAYRISQIPREENEKADALSKLASATTSIRSKAIPVAHLTKPSTAESEEIIIAEIRPSPGDWTYKLRKYLEENILPEDTVEAKRIRYRSARYTILMGELYRRGFSKVLQRCISGEKTGEILRSVHSGVCGNHTGGKSLAHKILRQGFYWPTLFAEAQQFAESCETCQRVANDIR
ncbi:hypothetical protein LWI29_037332 [Acer saccharum]|uniref:RNase H type-1 domain-containing protein n=1 Tax=Acer saccharum TaxID=4024 RepID=A0AA39VBC8_ACESA|nr:hypothetical protein LWI29_037332 [Acer saccharum]